MLTNGRKYLYTAEYNRCARGNDEKNNEMLKSHDGGSSGSFAVGFVVRIFVLVGGDVAALVTNIGATGFSLAFAFGVEALLVGAGVLGVIR